MFNVDNFAVRKWFHSAISVPAENHSGSSMWDCCVASVLPGTGTKTAVAARPRDCTLCRECVRGEEWAERVELTRVKNHFICECLSSPECASRRECVSRPECNARFGWILWKNHSGCCALVAVNIESTGCLPPGTLFTEAVNILKGKASRILSEIS